MHLKIFNKNGEIVTNTRTGKKRRILYRIQANKTPDARFFIRAFYSKGFTNSGEYDNKEDLLLALNAFTEGGYGK